MIDYYEILKLRPSDLTKLETKFTDYLNAIKNAKTPFSASRLKSLKKAIVSFYLLSDDKNRLLYNRLFLDGNINPHYLEAFARIELEYNIKANRVIAKLKTHEPAEGEDDAWLPIVMEGLLIVIE